MTYIPSTHEGSLTSSMEKSAFNSGVEINFSRGAEGVGPYFFPTGYITCNVTLTPFLKKKGARQNREKQRDLKERRWGENCDL